MNRRQNIFSFGWILVLVIGEAIGVFAIYLDDHAHPRAADAFTAFAVFVVISGAIALDKAHRRMLCRPLKTKDGSDER